MPEIVIPPVMFKGEADEHVRKVALGLEQVIGGKTNNLVDITLEANSTETRVSREGVNMDTRVAMTPKTATAAAAIGSGTLYATTTFGEIIVHHDSTPDTDRTFGAILVG